MALVWVLYAFVELFLYLPLLSGAFLAYAQVWETDPMPAAFWWRDIGRAIGNLADLSPFRRKRLAVIGKGQSALEYAALLHEQKADVQIVTRSGFIDYLPPRWRLRLFRNLTPGPLRPLSYMIRPPTDLGNIRTARLIADPLTLPDAPGIDALRWAAFCAASVEWLCGRYGIACPSWVHNAAYCLPEPWFDRDGSPRTRSALKSVLGPLMDKVATCRTKGEVQRLVERLEGARL